VSKVDFLTCHLQADAAKFVAIAQEVNAQNPAKVDNLDDKLMRTFAYNATGDICPMQAVIGGITAQEVMKVWSLTSTFSHAIPNVQ